ncbi:glycosyltransferase family 9 protein [Candidatus Pelagibacter communis]|uniref:glycosyltransferase family 9 protein n=1 Tax=Pelagibacter ubique TaxID=198252 RepID=UPI00094C9A40|nr:glycosyltransferase family 9 protein [Candidatus Pelagibacter ubique]
MNDLELIAENIKKKNLDKALELCKLNENSNDKSIIYNFIGVIHFMKKNLAEAENFFLKVIKIDDKFQDPIRNLCVIYAITKKFKELLNYSTKLYYLDNKNPLNIFQIGSANELNKNYDEAIKYYEKYINTDGSDKKRGFNNIGNIFLKKGKPKTSVKYFSKALELDSNNKILINNILLCYLSLRDENKAEEYFKRAEIIDSDYIEFLHNKAEFLILKNQLQEAEKILKNNKGITKFLITLIRLYFNSGQSNKGNELLNQSREILKNNSDFYNYLGIRYLYEGNFDEGWKYYEFRKSKLSNFFKDITEWDGTNIKDKSIVVYNEQGLGDSIQFSKYLLPLSKVSNKITFVVQENIKNLFKELKNINIKTYNECKNQTFDFKISLGSLIKFFYKEEINLEESLIEFNHKKKIELENKIDFSKKNIGLVWSGSFLGPNEPYRSIPLNNFRKILSLNANFYALQNEVWERDLEYFKSSNLIDCGNYKLDELSSLISKLDLVITCDTSLLHLASSLNIETWGILCLYPDWRWGEFNKFNPYNKLKLFNQKQFCNWDFINDEVYELLEKKLN